MIKYLVIATLAALAPALPASADPVPGHAVGFHNEARAFYGIGPVEWDATLREDAKWHARTCSFAPSDHDDRYGENLYVTTSQADDATVLRDAVVSWANEAAKFDVKNHRYAQDVSYYIQAIGAKTGRLGIAIADCPAGTIFAAPTKFVVARYQGAVKAAS
uniref:CAP domain-containing protein n=1 Tax=Herbidospora sakaeratensis TaxID=564415 RepID=UPI0007850DA0|nr:CAP domain-containing protein [Herbidospora sakaeratensis]